VRPATRDPINAPKIAHNRQSFAIVRPARDFGMGGIPAWVNADLAGAYAAKGLPPLHSPGRGRRAVHTGKNVVIVTPTASGKKTLCYNLPVLNATLENSDTRALYLFPTKALAQDRSLNFMTSISGWKPLRRFYLRWRHACRCAAIPFVKRTHRSYNQDMLHTGILPHHTRWTRLFENLR